MTIGIVHFDHEAFPNDFCNPEPFDEAVEHAKKLAEQGFETRVYKLVETHYFAGRPDADAVKSG